MRRSNLRCITDRAPVFLKQAYLHNVMLVDHEGWIKPLEVFIKYEKRRWVTYRMTAERVPVALKRYESLTRLLFDAQST